MKKHIPLLFLILFLFFSCDLLNQNNFSELEINEINSGLRIMERLIIDILWNSPEAFLELENEKPIHLVWSLWNNTAKAEAYLTNTQYYQLFEEGYTGTLPLTISLTKNFDTFTEKYYSLDILADLFWKGNNIYKIDIKGDCIISDLYFQGFSIKLIYLLDDYEFSSVSGYINNGNKYLFY